MTPRSSARRTQSRTSSGAGAIQPSRQPGTAPSALEEMHVVMTIAASFQQATQHADEKARALATLYMAISTAAATQSQKLVSLEGAVAGIVWTGTAIFIAAFLSGGYWLVQANRPRMT